MNRQTLRSWQFRLPVAMVLLAAILALAGPNRLAGAVSSRTSQATVGPEQRPTTTAAASVEQAGFRVTHRIAVGRAPHGIRFSADGRRAWVALSGDGAIAVVDLEAMEVTERIPAGDTPLDLVVLPGGVAVVTQFRGTELIEVSLGGVSAARRWDVGQAPSLFSPRLAPDPQRPGSAPSRALLVSEFADLLSLFDTNTGEVVAEYPTGNRPYPADFTADGGLAFVPNRDAGTVSVIDLRSGDSVAESEVCTNPEGGAVTADDAFYIVACGGDDALVWLDTTSFEVVHSITGVGPRPFSVATTRDGRWGLVNNAGGTTVSIVDVAARRIVGQVEVGEQPIVVRVHPDGSRALVANEVSGTVAIIELPE